MDEFEKIIREFQEELNTNPVSFEEINKNKKGRTFGNLEDLTKKVNLWDITELQKEYYNKQPKVPIQPYIAEKYKQPITKDIEINKKSQDGIKEVNNKLNYELDWNFIEAMAKRMSKNKNKYPPYNWKRKMDIESLKQALFRHVIKVMNGDYNDEGTNDHFEAIALNAMFIKYQLEHNNG